MNRCKPYKNIMQEVLDGSASDRGREALTRHMSRCRACRDDFEFLSFSIDLLTSAPALQPGPDFTARTVQRAFRAGEKRSRRWKYSSWCLTGLMILLSTYLSLGWTSVMGPVAQLGLRRLMGLFLDIMTLVNVIDKLQTVLAELASPIRDAVVTVALGAGAPVLLGCLAVLCFMLFIFARSGHFMPAGLIKRR